MHEDKVADTDEEVVDQFGCKESSWLHSCLESEQIDCETLYSVSTKKRDPEELTLLTHCFDESKRIALVEVWESGDTHNPDDAIGSLVQVFIWSPESYDRLFESELHKAEAKHRWCHDVVEQLVVVNGVAQVTSSKGCTYDSRNGLVYSHAKAPEDSAYAQDDDNWALLLDTEKTCYEY